MYVNKAKGKYGSNIDFQKQKNHTPFRPGKGKYGNCQYNVWCRFCGNNGHSIHDCKKRKAMNAKKQSMKNKAVTGKIASATCSSNSASCKSSSATSEKSFNSCVSDIPSTSKPPRSKLPRKAELRWVPKV